MSWKKWINFAGFLVLSIMVLLLYGFTAYHSWFVKRTGIVVVIFIIAGLARGIIVERRYLWRSDHQNDFFISASIKTFAAVMAGAIIAFTLKVKLGRWALLWGQVSLL